MSSTRRAGMALAVVAVAAVAVLGVTTAIAQQDDAGGGTDPTALLERLDELEAQLPEAVPPTGVDTDADEPWGDLAGDAGSVRAVLDTLEPDLRRLYVDADDADGPVAEAVALVARGWLDVWHGTSALASAESHDLAFPLATFDDDGVATGADEIRGTVEIGLELILNGQARLLAGYVSLSELGEAPPDAQGRLDARAVAAETFDAEVRPLIAEMVSSDSPTMVVSTERFDTDAPGVEPRATSLTVVCVDREALEEAGGIATPEAIEQIADATPDRLDCPGLLDDES